jgi:hypothetical protein
MTPQDLLNLMVWFMGATVIGNAITAIIVVTVVAVAWDRFTRR